MSEAHKKLSKDIILERLKASFKSETEFNPPCPEDCTFRPFQKAGIEYMVTSPFPSFLLSDPPGLGKTIQAIGYANYKRYKKFFIICPRTLVENWEKELRKWHLLGKDLKIKIIENKTDTPKGYDVYITSYELSTKPEIKNLFIEEKTSLLIVDECHFLRNPATKRTKAILGKDGYHTLVKSSIFISGTGVVNGRPIEIYPTIMAACPQAINYQSRTEFWKKYCGGQVNPHTGSPDYSGASNIDELGQRLRAYCMVRRDKAKVLKDLPALTVDILRLPEDSNPEAIKNIVERLEEFSHAFKKDVVKKARNDFAFDELSRARRELGELKAPIAAELIKTYLDSGEEKVVVFAHHKEVLKTIAEILKEYGVVVLTGDTKPKDRMNIVVDFQTNPNVRVFLGSLTAAGVGITLTAASLCFIVEGSWVPGDNKQAVDRLHRIGQLNSVRAFFLTFKNSLDEYMLKRHIEKEKTNRGILDLK